MRAPVDLGVISAIDASGRHLCQLLSETTPRFAPSDRRRRSGRDATGERAAGQRTTARRGEHGDPAEPRARPPADERRDRIPAIGRARSLRASPAPAHRVVEQAACRDRGRRRERRARGPTSWPSRDQRPHRSTVEPARRERRTRQRRGQGASMPALVPPDHPPVTPTCSPAEHRSGVPKHERTRNDESRPRR